MKNKKENFINYLGAETRLFILECSVFIEQQVSDTLCHILDIDINHSKSFGFNSSSLNFSQKITLIQDVKGITQDDSNKIDLFMQIRNKFAHVQSINSFESFFNFSKNTKKIKTKLDSYYSNNSADKSENEEKKYKVDFLMLTIHIFKILYNIDIGHEYERGLKVGKEETKNDILNLLTLELNKTKEGNELLSKVYNQLKDKSNSD
ncbi:MAG: hypothetical protein J5I47_01070 [Vicingus serpentipes]|nr:hypothetical protein [Vicingus serpentipes]